MQDLPIIFLIQGAFQTPAVYEQLVQRLHALGLVTVQPSLPSSSNTESPDFSKTTLVDDALAMRLELVRQIEYEGKTVLVAMHSYGGLVGSEAIPEELSHSKRQALGLPGGVIHLFYFCAFVLDEGQSVLGTFGEASNAGIDDDGRLSFLDGEQKLYGDLPNSEASLWASRLVASSYSVQKTKLTRAAWRYIPSTYLICDKDQTLPPQLQETFAASANAHTVRCSAGHSPMLSQPDMLAQRIRDVALGASSGPVQNA
ncbi:MAG: hypothetical protein Q9193_004873 [Seirophora villosa]